MMFPIGIAGVCGLIIGCVLNTLVYRLSDEKNLLITEDCFCPGCGHRLSLWEQIPVLGYCLLGGRCRYCKGVIDIHYPLVEGGLAVLYAVMAWICLPQLSCFLICVLCADVILAAYLLHRMCKKQSGKMRIRIKKIGCAFLLLVFFHILIMIAIGIALLN